MSVGLILWQFEIVFVLHDLEEIIVGPPWLRRHAPDIAPADSPRGRHGFHEAIWRLLSRSWSPRS